MVKMNGCAAIDSARPFRFLADKAAVAADFHLRKWRLLTWETENSKHSKCSYTCENRRGTTGISLQNSKQAPVSTHTGACHSGKQCSRLYTRAILLGKCPKPLNDFREIGCAPAELNINLSSESESWIFGFTAFRQIRFCCISVDRHFPKVSAHILYTKLRHPRLYQAEFFSSLTYSEGMLCIPLLLHTHQLCC